MSLPYLVLFLGISLQVGPVLEEALSGWFLVYWGLESSREGASEEPID